MKCSVRYSIFTYMIWLGANVWFTEEVMHVGVVGMFKIFEPKDGKCSKTVDIDSVMAAEAVEWYFRSLSETGGLPVAIDFQGQATCNLNSEVSSVGVDVMYKVKENIVNSTTTIGVVGPETDEEAELLSTLLSSVPKDNRLLQIGFSTTAARLGNPEKYPNFVRVIPNDMTEVDAMVQTMLKLGWNRVAIIHDESDGGRNGEAAVKYEAKKAGICVSFTAEIRHNPRGSEIISIRNQILFGNSSHPQISGIVFWGSQQTAEILFESFDNSAISDIPITILSVNTSTILKTSHYLMENFKGSYTVRPPSGEVDEFSNHWREIFTNETVFQEKSSSNLWLRSVYETIRECELSQPTCIFTPLSEDELGLKPQSLSVRYAIMAAHLMAKGVRSLYMKICGDVAAQCPEFGTELNAGDMIDEVKDIVIDMENDFPFRLSAFENMTWEINNLGEIEFPANTSSYDLYNFRDRDESDSLDDFQLIKVGELKDGVMEITTELLRDYDAATGNVKQWPNLRKGVCRHGTVCSECMPSNIADEVLVELGDVYVIGLVPIHNAAGTNECGSMRTYNGYQIAEAIKFAVTSFNINAENSNFAKVGYIILNSCNSASVVQRRIASLQETGIYMPNGTLLQLSGKIIGFLGDVGSGISIAASEIITNLKYVQISYASSSPALSDRERHPFFMRVVAPATEQVRAMLAVIKAFDSDYVQIIYSKGAYGEDAKDAFVDIAKSNGVCVVQRILVDENANFYSYFEELRKFPHAKVIVVFLRSHVVRPFFKVLSSIDQLTKGTFTYIGSTSWSTNVYVLLDDARQITTGSVVIEQEHIANKDLDEHVSSMQPTTVNENPWIQEYLELKLDCYFPSSFKKKARECVKSDRHSFEHSEWITTAHSATEALLKGAKLRIDDVCGPGVKILCQDFVNNPADLIDEIKKADGGALFDDNGDGTLGFNVYQVVRSKNSSSMLFYEKVGQYSPGSGLTLIDVQLRTVVTSVCPNQLACSTCFETAKPSPTTTTYTSSEPGLGTAIFGALFGISFAAVVVLVIVVVYLKKKVAGPDDPYANPYLNPIFRQDSDYIQAADIQSEQSGGSLDNAMHF